jgi:hypothetical protein
MQLVLQSGPEHWSKIATGIPGRTDRQCCARYKFLDSKIAQRGQAFSAGFFSFMRPPPQGQAPSVGFPPPPPQVPPQPASQTATQPAQQQQQQQNARFDEEPAHIGFLDWNLPSQDALSPRISTSRELFDTGSLARELLDENPPDKASFDIELFHRDPFARDLLDDPFEGL